MIPLIIDIVKSSTMKDLSKYIGQHISVYIHIDDIFEYGGTPERILMNELHKLIVEEIGKPVLIRKEIKNITVTAHKNIVTIQGVVSECKLI